MTLSVVTVTLTLLITHSAFNVDGSKSAQQLLQFLPSDASRENTLYQSKRESGADSPDYISGLWSNIEDAFRFLEKQPVDTTPRERSLMEDLQSIRKKEKISRLPFTQHNFIRFGKRFVQNQDARGPSLKTGLAEGSNEELRRIVSAIQAPVQTIEPSYDSPIQLLVTGQTDSAEGNPESDSPSKRRYHKFVRIGKRYFNVIKPRPQESFDGTILTNDDTENSFGKRRFSKFVRIG